MGMTDPIADLLTRIRNGLHARKEQVEIPWSRVKEGLAHVIASEGFVGDCSVVEQDGRKMMRVLLKYDERNKPVISGIKRISRPSLRVYVGVDEIPTVRGGMGTNILSTPQGFLTDREARKRNVGGEVVCAVW
jgi:small subunit ribosomal protein S8